MQDIEKKSRRVALFICLIFFASACGGLPGISSTSGQTPSKAVEGKDYLVLKRVRVLDEMGFDKPVEAMSMLVPNGWRTEGGVRWKGVNECRGEIVTWQFSATSPDGAIKFAVLPTRSFSYSKDQMLQQILVNAANQGGCQVSPPFTAQQYLENLARSVGASAADIRKDETLQAVLDKVSANGNATSQQYGTGMATSGTGVYGALSWSDGSKGLAQIGVMVMANEGRSMYTGAPNGFSTTMVFHQVIMRYPAAREAEALKLFGTITSSHRMNPIWSQAKESFLTRLGNAEHAGRMERLRLQGEQSKAYAKSQSDASDARMRDWERSQVSSDASQHRFIQTIREVETWKDGEGNPVELNAGYKYGWSKPDGSYILTDNSLFNPAVEFQQNWVQMQKPPR
jgi:hypothetical protein